MASQAIKKHAVAEVLDLCYNQQQGCLTVDYLTGERGDSTNINFFFYFTSLNQAATS